MSKEDSQTEDSSDGTAACIGALTDSGVAAMAVVNVNLVSNVSTFMEEY